MTAKPHRHRWSDWKKVMTMLSGLMWWRYCRAEGCDTHQHKKVRGGPR